MRTRYSLYNVVTGIVSQIIIALLGLISRRVFVDALGMGMQGVNGTLQTIISMLSLTELGIGTAIIYNLYRPLAEGDQDEIIALVQLYRRFYRTIALVVTVLGLAVCPFLPRLFADSASLGLTRTYLTGVFLLFLAEVVLSYLFAYKRSVIVADQKSFIVTLVTTSVTVITTILQIFILVKTQNYLLFLMIRVSFRIVENIVITVISGKMYPYTVTGKAYSVKPDVEENIRSNVKALALHYIGNYMITGTDTLIITRFLGTVVSGVYSNYQMITTTLRAVLGQFSAGITASFGNMLVTEEPEKIYTTFHRSMYIAFLMSNFSAVSLLLLLNPFIRVWIGRADALLPMHVVAIIVINFYYTVLSEPIGSLRASAGIFQPDKYLHIFLALLNLVVSVALVITPVGIFGVFFGTFICLCIKELTVLPLIMCRRVFHRPLWTYQKQLLKYSVITLISAGLSLLAAGLFDHAGPWAQVFLRLAVALIVPNLTAVVCTARSDGFRYAYDLVKKILGGQLRRTQHG